MAKKAKRTKKVARARASRREAGPPVKKRRGRTVATATVKKRTKRPRRRETKAARATRVKRILKRLHETYPQADCALNHRNSLQLLLATILSAQCTDKRVNVVTKALFRTCRVAADFAEASSEDLEEAIRTTGFFRSKAKSIKECCRDIVEKHNGEVPKTLEELTQLRGVGRKTANVVLGTAFGVPGVVVDTHVKRISNRLGLTTNEDPVKIEFDLMPELPESEWVYFAHAVIRHGRGPCKARKPDCASCTLSDLCPSAEV